MTDADGVPSDDGYFTRPHIRTDRDEPNVILFVLDTLRASRMGCYGYDDRPTTPFIDSLAASGAIFVNATSNSPGTFSSHMSLLTGLYPSVSGVSYRDWQEASPRRLPTAVPRLPDAISTVTEVLQAADYFTIGFASGYPLMSGVGFYRGFHRSRPIFS